MSTSNQPRAFAERAVARPAMPSGEGERFSGYGVMGLPFSSGHYLALRHFTASSIGPAYRAVWHRDPQGHWEVFADVPPEISCGRYLGPALTGTETVPIAITWSGDRSVVVEVGDRLRWSLEIGSAVRARMLSATGALLPDSASGSGWLLRSMSILAGSMMGAGRLALSGELPAGHHFGGLPRRMWPVAASVAVLDGVDLGVPAPLPEQDRLGTFWLPQRGMFYAESVLRMTPAAVTADAR